jgi:hypothetical protein
MTGQQMNTSFSECWQMGSLYIQAKYMVKQYSDEDYLRTHHVVYVDRRRVISVHGPIYHPSESLQKADLRRKSIGLLTFFTINVSRSEAAATFPQRYREIAARLRDAMFQ